MLTLLKGILKETSGLKETGAGLLKAVNSYGKGDVGGVLSAGVGLFKFATVGRKADEKAKRTKSSAADVVQWSGSKDEQTSSVILGEMLDVVASNNLI